MNLGDIYFIVFRHKLKILFLSLLTLVAAAAVYLFYPKIYSSQAKLLIRYVVERKATISSLKNESQDKSPDERGNTIINSEIEILASRDLVRRVVQAVGPRKILGPRHPNPLPEIAEEEVGRKLRVDVAPRSSVIRVAFSHPDPAVAHDVVDELVKLYQQKHLEIHRAVGIYEDLLQKQKTDFGIRLRQTEEDIKKLKEKAGVVSIEDAKRGYLEQIAKLNAEMMSAELELAERRAVGAVPGAETNAAANTNLTNAGDASSSNLLAASAPATTNEPPPVLAPGPLTPEQTERIELYNDLRARIAAAERQELDLLGQYTEESPFVIKVKSRIAELKKRKEAMEKETPSLLLARATSIPSAGGPPAENNLARIMSLEAKIKILNTQLEKLRAAAFGLDEAESVYSQLVRKKQQEEANLKFYTDSLEMAIVDKALGPGQVSNISVIEQATPGALEKGKLKKIILAILGGGFALAFGLAFVIELFLSQTVKRPIELERKVGLPTFMYLPRVRRQRLKKRPALPPAPDRPRIGDGETAPAAASDPAEALAPVLPGPPPDLSGLDRLSAYYEALRDRLITYFEMRNMTHKPKLVAVTGCSKGAGVSSIATGLATMLSETGDGKVLLVDMSAGNGSAHPFYRGKAVASLAEAIQDTGHANHEAQDRLYVATLPTQDGRLPRVLPKAFGHLVPRMKASDYDYIVFDMPPVSQTSPTARLASHMDMTLLVIEAEKDHVDVIRQAAASLREAKANVGALFNKKRSYVPSWLSPEA